MRYLTPMFLRPRYFKPIEKEINFLFDQIFYNPIREIYKKNGITINNARDALLEAIRTGKITYNDGKFSGSYSAAITKKLMEMGAKYNVKTQTWSIPQSQLPPEVSFSITDANIRFQKLTNEIALFLSTVRPAPIIAESPIPKEYETTIASINREYEKTIKDFAIPPELTRARKRMLAESWGENLELYINNWCDENIINLRKQVMKNAFEGKTTATLTKLIEQNYNVSRRKAEFLARQETSLLLSKFTEERYKDVGITQYKWSGVMDQRERIDHRELEGKVFRFDQPPVVNKKTGEKANPGEDYNCRCVAIAIIE